MPDGWPERYSKYREKLLEVLLLGLPTLLLQGLQKGLASRVVQPQQIVVIVLPFFAFILVAAKLFKSERPLLPRAGWVVFLGIYVALFSAGASSDLLNWGRKLTVFGAPASRTFLLPNWLGDWRYWLVTSPPTRHSDLLVLLVDQVPQPDTLGVRRQELAGLIAAAARNEARGVVLDFYFRRKTPSDGIFCATVASSSIPVISGFGTTEEEGIAVRDPSVLACLPIERQGHLIGSTDWDHVMRSIPLFFNRQKDRPALSLRAAQTMEPAFETPTEDFLYFLRPHEAIPELTLTELQKNPHLQALFRDRWLLVGENSLKDSFPTPYGRLPGVRIHAYALYSLLTKGYLRRTPWWSSFFIILLACYLVTLRASLGDRARVLILVALVSSVIVIFLSVAALILFRLWLDVVYALLAVWLFLALALATRPLRGRTRAP